jgi:hypothetical protein
MRPLLYCGQRTGFRADAADGSLQPVVPFAVEQTTNGNPVRILAAVFTGVLEVAHDVSKAFVVIDNPQTSRFCTHGDGQDA